MLSHENPDARNRSRWFRFGPCLALAAVILAVLWRDQATPASRLSDAASLSTGWADERSCVDCHEQAQHFWETGHANTLRPASDAFSRERLQRLNEAAVLKAERTQVQVRGQVILATHEQDQLVQQVPLTWCFGSGEHACTWTSVLPDVTGATDQLEFRWTWYRKGDQAAVTPGQPPVAGAGFFGHLGVLHDGPKSRRCLSCHTSSLPSKHRELEMNPIRAGVTCQRCHGPRQAHVESAGAMTNSNWSPIDRVDAVNRCAECHRRADEQEAGAIHKNNPDIVRFQPVGLVQSACFQKSEMSCTTCHNPHLPLSRQDSRGIGQCVQCHDPERGHTVCAGHHTENCIGCHMPKIRMEAPLEFTDHWIRVHDRELQ